MTALGETYSPSLSWLDELLPPKNQDSRRSTLESQDSSGGVEALPLTIEALIVDLLPVTVEALPVEELTVEVLTVEVLTVEALMEGDPSAPVLSLSWLLGEKSSSSLLSWMP